MTHRHVTQSMNKAATNPLAKSPTEPRGIAIGPPQHLFPLIRHLSYRLTALFISSRITPNQITLLGFMCGLAGVACFLSGDLSANLAGASLFLMLYLCDHCDGEVARLRHMQSLFGDRLSEFCGWIVHGLFFIVIGLKTAEVKGDPLWLYLGYTAAVGGTINFLFGVTKKVYPGAQTSSLNDLSHTIGPEDVGQTANFKDKLIFIFREIFAADFCFLLFPLAALDMLWVLLPIAAVGAHGYWAAMLLENTRRFHA